MNVHLHLMYVKYSNHIFSDIHYFSLADVMRNNGVVKLTISSRIFSSPSQNTHSRTQNTIAECVLIITMIIHFARHSRRWSHTTRILLQREKDNAKYSCTSIGDRYSIYLWVINNGSRPHGLRTVNCEKRSRFSISIIISAVERVARDNTANGAAYAATTRAVAYRPEPRAT